MQRGVPPTSIGRKGTHMIISSLSERHQDAITGWLLRTGFIFYVPVFKMLFRSMEFFGAEHKDLRRSFSGADDMGPSLVRSFRAIAHERQVLAGVEEKDGRLDDARLSYRRAGFYFLAADLFTYDEPEARENYRLAMPCFDAYRALCRPPVEKISLPHPVGRIMAHLRFPAGVSSPVPVVIIIQGNDTVKEWVVPFEEKALERGFATFSIDPPGWGESGLTGNRFKTKNDMKTCIGTALDFLQGRREIDGERIGIFGFSLGGMLAAYCAGLEPRIQALATLGAPYYKTIGTLWKKRPIIQQRRGNRYTGHTSGEEREKWTAALGLSEVISKVTCPTLLIHGGKDDFYPTSDAYNMAAAMNGKTSVRVIKGGDHMCTQSLSDRVAEEIFGWLADRI